MDFEQGIGYQGLVAEFWYSCVLLCDRNGLSVPTLVRERLGRRGDIHEEDFDRARLERPPVDEARREDGDAG